MSGKRTAIVTGGASGIGAATLLSERRGIGSQWIDRIAISDWKLEQTDSGRVLRVEI